MLNVDFDPPRNKSQSGFIFTTFGVKIPKKMGNQHLGLPQQSAVPFDFPLLTSSVRTSIKKLMLPTHTHCTIIKDIRQHVHMFPLHSLILPKKIGYHLISFNDPCLGKKKCLPLPPAITPLHPALLQTNCTSSPESPSGKRAALIHQTLSSPAAPRKMEVVNFEVVTHR